MNPMESLTRWWASAGGQFLIVEAATQPQARARAFDRLRETRVVYFEAAEIEVRPATQADVELFDECMARTDG